MTKKYTKKITKNNYSQIKKVVKQELSKNIETKFFPTSENGLSIQRSANLDPTHDTAWLLNGPTQGIEQTERIGSQIRCTGLYIRGNIRTVNNNNVVVRMVLYIPKDPSYSMRSDTYTVDTIVDQDKYTTLFDKLWTVNNQYPIKPFVIKRKLRNLTQFIGNSNVVSKNAIKLYLVSNVATDQPLLNIQVKCFYKDA